MPNLCFGWTELWLCVDDGLLLESAVEKDGLLLEGNVDRYDKHGLLLA